MLAEQTRDLLVQLADLLLDQLQVVQCQSYEPTVNRIEFGAGAQRITQLCRGWRANAYPPGRLELPDRFLPPLAHATCDAH